METKLSFESSETGTHRRTVKLQKNGIINGQFLFVLTRSAPEDA
jgi:hypothetical protein